MPSNDLPSGRAGLQLGRERFERDVIDLLFAITASLRNLRSSRTDPYLGTIWEQQRPNTREKRGSGADQKAGRINKIDVPALSAKPPSPVQIRAAPPKSLGKPARLCICGTIRRVADGLNWPQNHSLSG
jgi:hypothetical protein